jgi:alpha-tubulin suppressor-like RCC1 family protein
VVAVAAGARHSLALTAGGQVWAFGNNQRGQLGVGDLTSRTTPTQVIGTLASVSITAITAGQYALLDVTCHPFFSFMAGSTAWLSAKPVTSILGA